MTKRIMQKILAVLLLVLLVGTAFRQPLTKLAQELTFYWFEHTETELKVKAYAEEHRLFFADYPESMIALLERNPETEEFVLEYPLYEKEAYDLRQETARDAVPLFLQWDQRWGYETYGSDCMGITGCGPTCLAMVGYYLTGERIFDPRIVAEFAEENGYYVPGSGSSWTLISEGGQRLGLTVTELPLDQGRMERALAEGKPVILAMGPGDFTTTGHYIVLTGVVEGKFSVNDPNSVKNSEKLWSYEDIQGQIRNIWAVGVKE